MMHRRRTDAPAPSVEELRAHLYAEHRALQQHHIDLLDTADESKREFLQVQLRVSNENRHNLLVNLSQVAQ